MNFADIAFRIVGVIGGLLALVAILGALKGMPVRPPIAVWPPT